MRIEIYHDKFGIVTDGDRYEITYRSYDDDGRLSSACFEDGIMLYSDGEVPAHEVQKMLVLASELENSNDKIKRAFELRTNLEG